MLIDTDATICAIATGHLAGPRGAVRISGWETQAVLQRANPHWSFLRKIKTPTRMADAWDLGAPLGSIPADLWYWPTARSYTGMPSAEIHTIGHPLLLERIIEQLGKAGARLAQPGEFTLRAFLAGRLDLPQCEAVLGVIDAESPNDLEVALKQLAGGISQPLSNLRQSLIDLLADLEAGLDFVDEDIEFISPDQVTQRLVAAHRSVEGLSRQLVLRHATNSAPCVALLGLPNAGKSSLANALARVDASIVSEQAGTTRDFLRIPCSLPHGEVILVDTAGLDDQVALATSANHADLQAQKRTHELLTEVELILYCIDSHLPLEPWHLQIAFAQSLTRPLWLIVTKSDPTEGESTVKSHMRSAKKMAIDNHPSWNSPVFITSCFDDASLSELRAGLDTWLLQRDHEASSVAPMTVVRCKRSLEGAKDALEAAIRASTEKVGDEIVAGEIRLTLEHLAEVAGDVYTEDVLDSLFSRFCIGK